MFAPEECGEAFRRQYGLENRFVVLYAGAHGLSNDLGVLLQAACLLRDDPRICFVLVGDGKDKARLQAQATELALENVRFVPPVPKSEMAGVMAAADACLAILKPLDLYKTTYPNKVFDYLAAGRPVLLAIDGVIRQVVEAAGAGIAVTPGDPAALAAATRRLAANPEQARAMGTAGRQYIQQHFDRQVLAEKLALLLVEMRGQNG
jgi:glycosyltransferase involved in cell wall biosynthesis